MAWEARISAIARPHFPRATYLPTYSPSSMSPPPPPPEAARPMSLRSRRGMGSEVLWDMNSGNKNDPGPAWLGYLSTPGNIIMPSALRMSRFCMDH